MNEVIGLYNRQTEYELVMFVIDLTDFSVKEEGLVNYGDRWWATDIIWNRNRKNNSITLACANGKVDIREDFGFEAIKSDWPLTDSIITCMWSSYSGLLLIVGDSEGKVRVCLLDSYTNEGVIVKHSSPVSALDISTDDTILVSGDDEGSIKVAYIPTKTLLTTIKYHSEKITNLYISASKIHLLAASVDEKLSIWDLRTQSLCILKEGFYNFSVSSDESKVIIVGKNTWNIIQNPLIGSAISVFGPSSDNSGYYKYLYEIMCHRNPEYNPEFNNWIISSNVFSTLHFYAYYHLSNHLKKALVDKALLIQAIDGMSPLTICLEYRAFVVNDIIRYLLEGMSRNQGYAVFFKDHLIKINEFGSEYIGDLYEKLLVEVINSRLPDFCDKTVALPIFKEIADPLEVQRENFLVESHEGEIPQPIVFTQFLVPLCFALGSVGSIDFLQSLLLCSSSEIFRNEFIGLLLAYKWQKVRWIMRTIAMTYFAYLILYIVCIAFVYTFALWSVLLALSSLLTLYEIFQLMASPKSYFLSVLNYVDLARSISFYIYTYYIFASVETDVSRAVLVVLSVVSFIRGITFFETFSATRYMIFLLSEVWKDMVSFIILLFYTTMAITMIYLSIDYDRKNGNFFDYLLTAYRLGLGDFDLDGYSNVEKIVFAGGSLINTVIMLNLLISIMGDTFDRIQQGTIEADRRSLTEIILELEHLMYWKRKDEKKTYFFVCRLDDSNLDGAQGSWEGKIRHILDKLDRNKKQIDVTNKNLASKMKKMKLEFRGTLKTFQSDFREFKEEMINKSR